MDIEVQNISNAIKKCHSNKKSYIVRFNNSILNYVAIGHKTNNEKYLLYVHINKNKCMTELHKQTDESDTTTFFEAIGICDEYKLLFDQLKLSTKYSKKEISNLLRNELTLSGYSKSLFTVYINKNKI